MMILFYLVVVAGMFGYVILIKRWLVRHKTKTESNFTIAMLPPFPVNCKLYYEEKLGRLCKRCSSVGNKSELEVRKRYQVFKDADGILKVKDLTHVYHCAMCGYRGLYLTDKKLLK